MGEGSDKPPFDQRLAEIESELGRADPWERPTQARIRTIEEKVAPVSYPPASAIGKRWNPAGVVLVITAFGGLMTTIGVVLGPLVRAPDMTGYVKEERLKACETRLDERTKANDVALDGERARTTKCYDDLGACRSQQGAQSQVIESLAPKRRRQ